MDGPAKVGQEMTLSIAVGELKEKVVSLESLVFGDVPRNEKAEGKTAAGDKITQLRNEISDANVTLQGIINRLKVI